MSLICTAVLAAVPVLCAGQEEQVPWPSADAVAKATRAANELYRDRVAKAKKPCDKSALGAELLAMAQTAGTEPAAQYALFYGARNLGAEAKDWALTSAAIGAIVERFKANGPTDPEEQIRRGDLFNYAATQETLKEKRLRLQLDAAEWYARAQRSNGLQSQIADRRLTDLAKTLGWKKTAGRNWMRIVNRESGLALGVREGRLTPGADILQWDSPATATETHWFVERAGAYCRIVNRKTGQCLAIASGSKEQGHRVCQWPAGGPESLWLMEHRGEGFFRLTNCSSGFCLDMPNPRNKGAVAIQWAFHGGPNQQWRLEAVESD